MADLPSEICELISRCGKIFVNGIYKLVNSWEKSGLKRFIGCVMGQIGH
jgi:hypothetical protein